MLDLEELKFLQRQGVWRYCHSSTTEFGNKIPVEKWKYVMFESILRDLLRLRPTGEKEDVVVRAVLDQIPSELKRDLVDAEAVLRITLLDLEFRNSIVRRGPKGQIAKLRLKKEPMPDVPMHLAKLSRNVAQHICTCEFDVACSCENTNFTVLYQATCIHDDQDGSVRFADLRLGNSHLFCFQIKCDQCEARHDLFDRRAHGWDGFHRCLAFGQKSQDEYPSSTAESKGDLGPPAGAHPTHIVFKCPVCTGLSHMIHVSTAVDDDYEDFKDHYRDNRSLFKGVKMKEGWSSTFGSIAIELTCTGCGANRTEVHCETA